MADEMDRRRRRRRTAGEHAALAGCGALVVLAGNALGLGAWLDRNPHGLAVEALATLLAVALIIGVRTARERRRDLAQQRIVSEQLREAEARFRNLVENLPAVKLPSTASAPTSRSDQRSVVGAEPAREDDGAEPTEIDALRRPVVERLGLLDLLWLGPPLGHQLAHEVHELPVALVPPGDALGQVHGEPRVVPLRAEEVPRQHDPHRPQRPKMQVVTASVPGGEYVRVEARGGGGQRLDRGVQEPVSFAHHTMSRPPRRRGTHGAFPHARTTSRPAWFSSSAI